MTSEPKTVNPVEVFISTRGPLGPGLLTGVLFHEIVKQTDFLCNHDLGHYEKHLVEKKKI